MNFEEIKAKIKHRPELMLGVEQNLETCIELARINFRVIRYIEDRNIRKKVVQFLFNEDPDALLYNLRYSQADDFLNELLKDTKILKSK